MFKNAEKMSSITSLIQMAYGCVKLEVPNTHTNLLSYRVGDIVGLVTLRVALTYRPRVVIMKYEST